MLHHLYSAFKKIETLNSLQPPLDNESLACSVQRAIILFLRKLQEKLIITNFRWEKTLCKANKSTPVEILFCTKTRPLYLYTC